MNTDLRTARRLRRAVGALKRHGWCQGQATDAEGRFCAVGAIGFAVRDSSALVCSVRVVLEDFANLSIGEGWYVPLANWNDEPGRTLEDVISLFESAALALEVRALASEKTEPSSKEIREVIAVGV